MIVLEYIKILLKGCIGKIILKKLRILLISYFIIQRIFSGNEIRCPCAKCKDKNFYHKDLVIMHLLKKGFKKYLC
jgi:hypothetical protein